MPKLPVCSSPAAGTSGSSTDQYASLPPLPATQRFLAKLKGKRSRPTFEALTYGMPVRLAIHHIGIFVQAATHFERQHALSVHVRPLLLVFAPESVCVLWVSLSHMPSLATFYVFGCAQTNVTRLMAPKEPTRQKRNATVRCITLCACVDRFS